MPLSFGHIYATLYPREGVHRIADPILRDVRRGHSRFKFLPFASYWVQPKPPDDDEAMDDASDDNEGD